MENHIGNNKEGRSLKTFTECKSRSRKSLSRQRKRWQDQYERHEKFPKSAEKIIAKKNYTKSYAITYLYM